MKGLLYGLLVWGLHLQNVLGLTPPRPLPPTEEVNQDVLDAIADPDQPAFGISHFEQYIDHKNPQLGKFNQTFWYNTTFYRGPGSPIILFTPGEEAAVLYLSYLSDATLTGLIAKEVGGAVVLVEHRYWGNSTPFEVQSTKNLQFLTLDQSVTDFTHFARTAKLPFDTQGDANAPKVPWIWVGGSYSGALGAWIESLQPGTFWATHASSGPVQAIYDYWEYFYPIQRGMPHNCSKDYQAIVEHVDRVFAHGSPKEQGKLKDMFGLGTLPHIDDVAVAISSPIWEWQNIQFYSGYSQFYQMCDAIEGFLPNSTNSTVHNALSASGIGLKRALPNFATWFRREYLPQYCARIGYEDWQDPNSILCFDTYNASSPMFTDWSASNKLDRTWVWMTCNDPFFYYQTGAPRDKSTIFTRFASTEYSQRQCELFFPREGKYTYASAYGRTAQDENAHTKGWYLPESLDQDSRLLWVNGEYDPWRSAGVASEFRRGGPWVSTPDVPAILMPGSRHCSDLRTRNGVNNTDVKKAQNEIVAQMAEWTKEFYSMPRENHRAVWSERKPSTTN
ncbi:putative serine peptidase [Xylariaceae sp. FL0016]|nr:putative serine peptidase [Xylariaceae sp. FL0016]